MGVLKTMWIIGQESHLDPLFKGSTAGLFRYATEVWLAASKLRQQKDVMAPVKLEGLVKAVRDVKEDDQGIARPIKGGLDFLGWSSIGASTITVNK